MSMFESPAERKMMTQVKLVRQDGENKIETVVWLESDGRLRRGLVLKLVGEQVWWTVDAVYSKSMRKSIRQDWEVGGIVNSYRG